LHFYYLQSQDSGSGMDPGWNENNELIVLVKSAPTIFNIISKKQALVQLIEQACLYLIFLDYL
jgi:hypothetical protein